MSNEYMNTLIRIAVIEIGIGIYKGFNVQLLTHY